MKYRIVNISYWKQFTQYTEPEVYMKIRGWMNDEVHELDEFTAQHGLLWNCISAVPQTDVSMEEMTSKVQDTPEPVEQPKAHETVEDKPQFVCDVCGKVCKNSLGLGSHKKSHAVKA